MFTFILAAILNTLPTLFPVILANIHQPATIHAKKDELESQGKDSKVDIEDEKNSEDSTQPEDYSSNGKAVSCSEGPEQVTVEVEVIAPQVDILDLDSGTGYDAQSYSELTAWGKRSFLPFAARTRS